MTTRPRPAPTPPVPEVRPAFLLTAWGLGCAGALGLGLLAWGWPPPLDWSGLTGAPALLWPLTGLIAGPLLWWPLSRAVRRRPTPPPRSAEPLFEFEEALPSPPPPPPPETGLDDLGHAVFAYDADGRVRLWNTAASRLLGYAPEQILGERAARLLPPWCTAELEEHLDIVREGHTRGGIATQRLTHLGGVVDVELAVSTYRPAGQEAPGVLCSLFELTPYRQQGSELELLSRALEAAPEAILVTDPENDNLVVFANAAASRLTGYPREELVGQNPRFLYGGERLQDGLKELRECVGAGRGCRVVLRNFRKDGEPFWNELAIVPVRSEGGRLLRFIGVLRDLSGQRAELEGLEQRIRTLSGMLEQAPVGVAVCNEDGVIQEANPLVAKLLGLSPVDLEGRPLSDFATWPENSAGGLPGQGELVIHRADGKKVTARLRRSRCRTDPSLYALYLMDITARKHAERSLEQEQERMQGTLASMGDAVITTNTQGVVDYLNPAAEACTGWRNEEGQGLSVETVFQAVDEHSRERLSDPVHRCLALGRKVRLPQDAILVARDGREIAVQASAAPIRDPSGTTVGAVLVLQDVSKMQRLNRQASTDPLTGLLNRRELERRLRATLDDSATARVENALCFLDLDRFKPINDACGHRGGDLVLQQIAALLRERVRGSDTVARIGGDEFALLLRDCTQAKALEIANGVCRAVANYRFDWHDRQFRLGASVGLVSIGALGGTVTDLMEAADAACYQAKKQGRNRVEVYQPGHSEAEARRTEVGWAKRIGEALETGGLRLEVQLIRPLAAQSGPPLYEVQVRYFDEKEGLVPPMAFLPTLERHGLLPDLDRWVVSETFRTLSALRSSGSLAEGGYLINLSGQSLVSPGFDELVLKRLADSGVEPQQVCFGLQVSGIAAHADAARGFLQLLRRRGCRLALEDFDNGAILLNQLRHLPVDFIKFERGVSSALREGPVGAALVEGLNHVAQASGARTIVSYVEDEVSLARLRSMEVDYVQGYAVGKPSRLGKAQQA